jgi:hypothetical protein
MVSSCRFFALNSRAQRPHTQGYIFKARLR